MLLSVQPTALGRGLVLNMLRGRPPGSRTRNWETGILGEQGPPGSLPHHTAYGGPTDEARLMEIYETQKNVYASICRTITLNRALITEEDEDALAPGTEHNANKE
ncbi:unnamed protein product [Arctogadus glacialis]